MIKGIFRGKQPEDDYARFKSEALKQLGIGNATDAFRALRQIFRNPGLLKNDKRWTETMEILAQAGEPIAGQEFAQLARAVGKTPRHVQSLFDFGYQLIEYDLPEIAAIVLCRANQLHPGDEGILTEYVGALERAGLHSQACEAIRCQPGLLNGSFTLQYLLAYNALMAGDLEEPSKLLPDLKVKAGSDATCTYMSAAIEGMLSRARALEAVAALDSRDLRGWHFVINGSVLTHISPHGFEEGMYGRYAFVQDSNERCLEGILRLQALLQEWNVAVPLIFKLADRSSAILAHALAQVLGAPIEDWEAGCSKPGLIVVYDIGKLEPATQAVLQDHHQGQILWSHALSWTEQAPFAPDVVTFLYQTNVTPWDGRLFSNPQTGQVERSVPDQGSVEELAAAVVSAVVEANDLADVPALIAVARAAKRLTNEHAAGAFVLTGKRRIMRLDSPVRSNRFA